MINMNKLKVEIWSDVMCPFCYIGKRKFENALATFEHKSAIQIEWKSFQLSPNIEKEIGETGLDAYDYVAQRYGKSREWSIEMHQNITQQAKEIGLEYNFDIAKMANSFDAHRISHLAKSLDKGNELEELLFKAYFTEGKDISSPAVLIEIGNKVGIDSAAIEEVLNSKNYTQAVHLDIEEAQKIGVQGVPFFVFDRKYAVSGAQSPEVFLETLTQTWKEWEAANNQQTFTTIDGQNCSIDGECD